VRRVVAAEQPPVHAFPLCLRDHRIEGGQVAMNVIEETEHVAFRR
jgi:hypothetical protein